MAFGSMGYGMPGVGMPAQLPQQSPMQAQGGGIPFSQNPMITALAASLLGAGGDWAGAGRNFGQMAPAAMATNYAMRKDQRTSADDAKMRQAWNIAMLAKSRGQPIPPDIQATIAASNPTIAAKMFADATGGGAPEYGLDIIPGVDAQGNVVPMQASKGGGLSRAALPEGVTYSPKGIAKDMGTYYLMIDPITGEPKTGADGKVQAFPKDVAGTAAQTQIGEGAGKSAVSLPTVMAAGDRMIRAMDDYLNDPAAGRVTGPIQSWLPNVTGESHRAQSKLDQIQGGTFLQAYNDLRGGGAITEREGAAATAAYNRLTSTGMKDEDYQQAVREFRAEVIKLMEIAKRKAAGYFSPEGAVTPPPTSGSTPDADGWITAPNGVRIRQVQ